MKLLRYGPSGNEKPGLLDQDGKIRDLCGHVSDITPAELVRRVTGRDLTVEPYMDYLWRKFGPLYGLRKEELGGVSVG